MSLGKLSRKEGWEITDDPYVISYGERFLFIDLAARLDVLNGIAGRFIGARRGSSRIAVEIKEFRGNSAIADARASECLRHATLTVNMFFIGYSWNRLIQSVSCISLLQT
jgi:hypothetical protein